MIVAMTGVSGNMGYEAFVQSIGLEFIERIKVLLTPRRKNDKLARRLKKTYGDRVEILRGWLNDLCVRTVGQRLRYGHKYGRGHSAQVR